MTDHAATQPPPPPPPGRTDPELASYADVLVESIVRFFATANTATDHRFGLSKTSICLHLTDAEPRGVSMYFNRSPVETVGRVDNDTESHIFLTTDLLASVILGRTHIGMAIAKGDADYKGPVRKFLRTVPLMRTLDVSQLKDLAEAAKARRKHQAGD